MNLSAGTRLGPYEVVAPLGMGGMGEVFSARDTRLDRSVAIKVLPSHLSSNPELRERFEREARAISALNHPNICTLYDVGHQDGIDYIVMELLEGDSLAERLARGPLPRRDVLTYGAQIAEALDRAHRAAIVHRDLKPANIVLTRSGAKLLDFGLAKQAEASVATRGLHVESHMPTAHAPEAKALTEPGMIIGTFQYMAPEQLEGEDADARTDIFALGAVLYEMATGRRAFEGKTKTSLIAAIVSGEPPPISSIQPLTPPALEHVVARCLAKERDARWQSAADLAAELRWIAATSSEAETRKPRISPARRALWTLVAMAALLLAALVARSLWKGKESSAPRYHFAATSGLRVDDRFILSPDGRMLVFSEYLITGAASLWMRDLGTRSPRRLPGTENAVALAFSPDGQSILIFQNGKLARVPVAEGPARVIANAQATQRGSWEGEIILIEQPGGIHRVHQNDPAPRPVTSVNTSGGEVAHISPQILPGGARFLYTVTSIRPNSEAEHHLYVGSLDGKEKKNLGPVPSRAAYASGYLFFVREDTLLATPFDPENAATIGDPVPVADGVFSWKRTGTASFAAANGTVAYVRTWIDRLVWFDTKGGALQQIGSPISIRGTLSISDDVSAAYIGQVDRRTGLSKIHEYDLRRGSASRVTSGVGEEVAPVISRDGRRIFFASDRLSGPSFDIFETVPGTNAPVQLIVRNAGDDFPEEDSPDGRYLLFSTMKDSETKMDLWLAPLEGQNGAKPLVQTAGNDLGGRFSPDGRWLAYESDVTDGKTNIYLLPYPGPGRSRRISPDTGFAAQWGADGRKLYYLTADAIMVSDIAADGTSREVRRVASLPERFGTYAVAPDDRILMAIGADETPIEIITGWSRR